MASSACLSGTLEAETTVAAVLNACPQAGHVFIALGTDCVGCYLARFCTLKEVAGHYDLSLDVVMEAFTQVVPDCPIGTVHE